MNHLQEIDGKALTVTKGIVRLCRLRDEYYDFVVDPSAFLPKMGGRSGVKADIFAFLQEIPDRAPKFQFHLEWDHAAVLSLSTFEHWWKKQIKDKTRNMVRKAQKSGVEIRLTEFNDELVRGIQTIYNETPVRQGKPFKHFGKDFETIRCEHGTFLGRSEFLGAYHNQELIGFVKLVHGRGISNLMNIVALVSHRDKAPTNALIAKAVEICSSRGIPYLQYGTGNSGSIGDFKRHHAFEDVLVPRYYVPLNLKGTVMLKLGLHRRIGERLPENWRARMLAIRSKWTASRFRNKNRVGAAAQSSEQRAQA
jgi:hypothetical protein